MGITDAWERIRQYLLKYKPISDEDKQDCHWLNCFLVQCYLQQPTFEARICSDQSWSDDFVQIRREPFKYLHVSVWWDVEILRDDVLWRVRSVIQRWHLIPVSGTKMTTCIARLPTLTGCGQRITKRLAEVTALSPRSPSLIFPGLD